MAISVDELKKSYLSWLEKSIRLEDTNGVIEITAPFLDRHNDHIQIYAVPNGNSFRLTDAGYIIGDLQLEGMDVFSTPKRKEIFQTILNGYGVKCSDTKELFVESTIDDFPQKKHMLIQAMVTVNDMFMLSRQNVSNVFVEDVGSFLDSHDINYLDSPNFTGKSGQNHRFDFAIPHSKSKGTPDRFIRTVNNPSTQMAEILLFSWLDTREVRRHESNLYVFLNDQENKSISSDIINAFTNYEVRTVLWSNRDKYVDELTA